VLLFSGFQEARFLLSSPIKSLFLGTASHKINRGCGNKAGRADFFLVIIAREILKTDAVFQVLLQPQDLPV
jgi:hypothetical protein